MTLLLAPAKLNLEFEITGKRPDGYHDIRTVMQTIFLHDYLWIEKGESFAFSGSLPCPMEDLLVLKAVRALEEYCGKQLPVWVHLDKAIPIGAGMGGGSSDAAATLAGVNEVYDLDLDLSELEEVAIKVGSDVPFFLHGRRCLVEGRGEKVTQLPDLPDDVCYVVFRPHMRLSTKAAYAEYDRTGTKFAEQAWRSCPQLKKVFNVFPDMIISGKGPTAFVARTRDLAEFTIKQMVQFYDWDGDIFLTGPAASDSYMSIRRSPNN